MNLKETIRTFEDRTVEKASKSNLGEVESVIANCDGRSRRRSWLGLENSIGKILDREVGVGMDRDEGLKSHLLA